jgi:protein-S-isoprenylcysteine O-methyltransferase Ste14
LIWVVSEIAINLLKRSPDNSKDRLSRLVLIVTGNLFTFLGVYIALTKAIGNLWWGNAFLRCFSIMLIIIGLIIRWVAVATLKQQFTVNVAIVQNHQVVDNGIYHYVRHPAYVGTLLLYLGLALYFGNWISFVIIFSPNLLAHLYRIAIEEKALKAYFGQEYIDYAAKTKRLIPKIY